MARINDSRVKTKKEAEAEIFVLVELIKRHTAVDISALRDHSYPEALKRLMYLRRRISHLK